MAAKMLKNVEVTHQRQPIPVIVTVHAKAMKEPCESMQYFASFLGCYDAASLRGISRQPRYTFDITSRLLLSSFLFALGCSPSSQAGGDGPSTPLYDVQPLEFKWGMSEMEVLTLANGLKKLGNGVLGGETKIEHVPFDVRYTFDYTGLIQILFASGDDGYKDEAACQRDFALLERHLRSRFGAPAPQSESQDEAEAVFGHAFRWSVWNANDTKAILKCARFKDFVGIHLYYRRKVTGT